MPALRFYFDFVSPYAYIVSTQVSELAVRHGRSLELVPVLFAALLDAHGTTGPAEVPAKRVYTFKDAYRKAHRLGLPPLCPPPSHPFNPLLALRAASLPMPEDARRRFVSALYAAAWADGTGVESAAQVGAAATRAGLDAAAIVSEASLPEAKARLHDQTAEAVSRGVFGVPTVLVDGEIFWGTDGVELAEAYLRGEDPVPRDLGWADRPASATRKARRS
jgi:2-hydroxychromene-2-carboxylate isomerase